MPIFDSHFHATNQPVYQPYLEAAKNFDIIGGALIADTDSKTLIKHLSKLPKGFVGIACPTPAMTDAEISELHQAGVRAIHFDLEQENPISPTELLALAQRVHKQKQWHTELRIKSTHLKDLRSLLYQLPAVSIDHLGLTTDGINDLYNLVEQGARVKVCGFRRLPFDQETLAQILIEIYAINPNALIFGSNLPQIGSTRGVTTSDINLIKQAFDEEAANNIFYKNALNFYQAA